MLTLPASADVEIVRYRPEYALDFARISLGWITAYFSPEPADLEVINDPQAHILDRGGEILFARRHDVIVGCVALVPHDEAGYELELCKMGVDPLAQGLGVGRVLLQTALEHAREKGARRVVLETNSRLGAALHLYRQAGFREVPMEPSRFARADVRMVWEA